jgi:alkanesulfonate monooxygenase SsuD/methylene tetrahydromethanopterin reductase-like flavin-dependent oxidoreductase (luciferase family)
MGEKKTLRIVAEHADGWNAFPLPILQMQQKLDVLRNHCDAAGRDYDAITKQLGICAIVREAAADVETELSQFAAQSGLPLERAPDGDRRDTCSVKAQVIGQIATLYAVAQSGRCTSAIWGGSIPA